MSRKLDYSKGSKSNRPSVSITGESWFKKERRESNKAKIRKAKAVAKAKKAAKENRAPVAKWAMDEKPKLIKCRTKLKTLS